MEIQEAIHSVVDEVSKNLVESLKALHDQEKRMHRESQIKKIKAIFGMIGDQSREELEQELNELEDPDLNEIAQTLLEKLRNDKSTTVPVPEQPKQTEKQKQKESSPPKKQVKPKQDRGNSLIKGVLGKFMKIEEDNARPMILPDKEPKIYYDEEKRKYVIEGEEEEEVKEIPKPPPAKKIANGSNKTDGNKSKNKNEFDDMMAPPAYKRKGTKNKVENVKAKPNYVTFESFEEKIVYLLKGAEEKIFSSIDNLAPKANEFSVENFHEFANIGDEIRSAQEISDTLMTRLFASYIDSGFDDESNNKMIEKLVKLEQTNDKIISLAYSQNTSSTNLSLKSIKEEESKRVSQRLSEYEEQICLLNLEKSKLHEELGRIKRGLEDEKEKFRLNLESEVSENEMMRNVLEDKKKSVDSLEMDKIKLESEIRSIKSENKSLREAMTSFEKSISEEQKSIISSIIQKSNELALVNEISEAIIAENELYLAIQSKRISLCSQGKEQAMNIYQKQKSSSSLLELSDSFTAVVQHYENTMKTIKKENAHLVESNVSTKAELSRIQQNLSAENQSLLRSNARMKSLMEDCKQEKEEIEIKAAQLESENQGLQRQLTHLRKEHSYTKDVLEQNIRSSHDNTSVLKEQLESEIQLLEEQLEQKEINEKVIERELEETNGQIQGLIKESKSKGIKIGNLEKELKEIRSQLDESDAENSSNKIKISELENEINCVINRTDEEKKKIENNMKNIKQKLKTVEEDLKISTSSFSESKRENEEIMAILEESNSENEALKQKVDDLTNLLKEKEQQITFALQEAEKIRNETLEEAKIDREGLLLEIKNSQCQETEELNNEIKEYKYLYGEQTKHIETLLENMLAIKEEFKISEIESFNKIEYLMKVLSDNEIETEKLAGQVAQFQSIFEKITNKVNQIEENNLTNQEVERLEAQIQTLKEENAANLESREALESKIESNENSLNENKSQIASLVHSLSQKETSYQELKIKVNEMELAYCSLQEERDTFEQITVEMENETQKLMSAIENKDKEYECLNEKIKELEWLCENKQRVENQLRSDLQNLRQSHDEQLTEKMNIIEELESEIKDSEDRNRIKGEMEILKTENESLKSILNENTELIEVMHKEVENKERIIQEKQNELSTSKEELEANALQIQELRASQIIYESKINSLNGELSSYRCENSENAKEIKTERSQSEQDSDKMSIKSQLIQNIQSTKEEISNLNSEVSRLHKDLTSKEIELTEAVNSIQNQNTEIETLLLQIEKQEKEKSLLENEKKSLAEARDTLQLRISNIEKERLTEVTKETDKDMNEEQKELQQLVIAQDSSINEQNLLIEKLNLEIEAKNNELKEANQKIVQLGKEKLELHELYNEKSEQAEITIEKLEREAISIKNGGKDYEVALNKIKELELENTELLKEKSDILRAKDEILSKLIKYQEVSKEQPTPVSQERTNKTVKEQSINSNELAQKQNGFFGSLSSLFLTPTETNKMSSNGK